MRFIIILAGAVAFFAVNVHPMYVDHTIPCHSHSDQLTDPVKGIREKCYAPKASRKRGDVIHIKRDREPNKFHISVTDANGTPVPRDIDETMGFLYTDDDDDNVDDEL